MVIANIEPRHLEHVKKNALKYTAMLLALMTIVHLSQHYSSLLDLLVSVCCIVLMIKVRNWNWRKEKETKTAITLILLFAAIATFASCMGGLL